MAIRSRFVRAAISPPDVTAPSVPANLREIDSSSSSFSVLWDASTDNRSVLGYEIDIDGAVQAGLNQSTGYTKSGLSASTTYAVKVRAVDNSLNRSSFSSTVNITTTSSGGSGGDSLVPAPDTSTPDLYVHPSGTLAGNAAYTTIQAAVDAASPGQKIAVGAATYTGKVLVTKALTIRAYDPANRPVIDNSYGGGGWTGANGSAACVCLNASNIVWDGIDIDRPAAIGMMVGYSNNNGYFLANEAAAKTATATWYDNIKVYRTNITRAPGLALMYMYVTNVYFGAVIVRHCAANKSPYIGDYLENNNFSWPAAIAGAGDGVTFVESDCYQNLTEGWHFGLWYMNVVGSTPGAVSTAWLHTKNLTMTKCRGWDCWSATVYLGDVDTGTFDRCLFYKTTDTLYWHYATQPSSRYPSAILVMATESARSYNFRSSTGQLGSNDVTFKNTVFNSSATLWSHSDASDGLVSHDYLRIKFLNCTFNNVNQQNLWANDRGLFVNKYHLRDFTMQNCILNDSEGMMAGSTNVALLGTSTLGYNLWSHTQPSGYSGTGDIVNASTGLIDGTYLINNNYPNIPTFDTTSFTVSGSSPAVNAGTTAASVTTDYFGTTRPAGIRDIGAYTYRT